MTRQYIENDIISLYNYTVVQLYSSSSDTYYIYQYHYIIYVIIY